MCDDDDDNALLLFVLLVSRRGDCVREIVTVEREKKFVGWLCVIYTVV